MRSYTLREAKFRADTHYFSKLRLIIRNLRRRRELLKLERLSAYQLRDIGFTPADLRYLGSLPLTADIDWERERLNLIHSRRISSTGNR
jgi:uncharacterized protein YjiS (DUF1127 family)